jgi:hypothetical protein
MEWGPLVGLKATGFAEVVTSNAIGALYLHCIGAYRALWSLCKSLHLQQKVEISAPVF